MRTGYVTSFVVVMAACGGAPSGTPILPTGPGNVGDPCMLDDSCRSGLICDRSTNTCQPGHKQPAGTPCVISSECADGFYCGPQRTCAPAGNNLEGTACSHDGECARTPGNGYLRCNITGFGGVCRKEGGVDQTQKCVPTATNADCFGALGCWKGTCTSLVQTCKADLDCRSGLGCAMGFCRPVLANPSGLVPLTIADYDGETCKDEPGATQAYFRVPRGMDDGDFYRLPFPNDIRKKNGRLDLSGHPTPKLGGIGIDYVSAYLRDLEQNADGFSPYPTIFFRFSANVDFASLKQNNVVRLVDLTTGNDVGGHQWVASTARNKYLCDNWLALRPYFALTLVPGHVYAGIITTATRDAKMMALQRSDDMTALLQGTPPSDASLTAAYTAYAPLRTWATTKMFDPNTVLVAAVFTVGHPETIASRVPAAVAAAPVAVAANWVKCGAGQSPCAQATGERACGAPDPAFDELHALVTIPIFQNGGGGVDVDMAGTPQFVRSDQVCLSLTVPKGVAMPAQGWPLVVYAHDTDRNFRSDVKDGIAARLSSADDGLGGQVHMAVLGIDQVGHGTRRTSTDAAPVIVLADGVPAAARGNRIQAAADQLALVRFARALDLTAMQSPTGAAIKFNRVLFWGHGRGASDGTLSLPYADVPAIVASGQSASIKDTMLGRQRPMNTKVVLPFVLQDAVDDNHPVMALLQNAIEPADALVHASAMTFAPKGALLPKHVFQPYAQGDTFTPSAPQLTYAFAAALAVATPTMSVMPQDPTLIAAGYKMVPVFGNLVFMGQNYTQIIREYSPGAEGHAIVVNDITAMADVDHFLADAARGIIPRVGR